MAMSTRCHYYIKRTHKPRFCDKKSSQLWCEKKNTEDDLPSVSLHLCRKHFIILETQIKKRVLMWSSIPSKIIASSLFHSRVEEFQRMARLLSQPDVFQEDEHEAFESSSDETEDEDSVRDDILTTIIENQDFSRYDLTRLIIDADFRPIRQNINSFNKFGETPLMTAVRVGDKDMVRLLLWKDADPHLSNAENQNAFDFAQQHPDGEELEYILEKGP